MAWQGNIKLKIMKTIEDIWALLNPQGEYKRRRGACERLWHGYDVARQEAIYMQIKKKLEHGEFVHENPYFAIEDNARHIQAKQPRTQTLTFKEYYARFGTTAEQDGWKMANPTGQQVIYVKG
jgi:hypothetical protein